MVRVPVKPNSGTVLIVRLDRLGDVLVSLPAMRYATELAHAKGWSTVAWVQPEYMGLVERSGVVDRVEAPEAVTRARGLKRMFAVANELGSGRFSQLQHVILLQYEWGLGLGARRRSSRVSGVWSKWSSFATLTHGLRQNRSRGDRHEADFGLEIVAHALGGHWRGHLPEGIQIPVHPSQVRADVVLHPGMGGSARNWPASRWRECAEAFIQKKWKVAVSIGPADLELGKVFGGLSLELWKGLTLEELAARCASARLVIAPSTGPVHLAACVGVPVLGLYSPIRVQKPTRWSPLRIQGGGEAATLVPKVECPEVFRCRGPSCEFWDCMERVTVEAVVAQGEKICAR